MSTDAVPSCGAAGGVLLLCRARPDAVAPVVPVLRERVGLAEAGDGWTLLVPEGTPWRSGETVERVATGWAYALAVGVSWPVLAVWWDADRCGCVLASGFRRPVGYVWLANGTAVGEDEAMRTLGEGLGVASGATTGGVGALLALTRPDSSVDGGGRLRGLLTVLEEGVGVRLPEGVVPGESAEGVEGVRVREVVREVVPGVAARGRAEGGGGGMAVPGVGARVVALAQVGVGVPVVVWGVRRRRGGWVVAGLLLVVDGVVGGVRAGGWGWWG
ncbi:hypothetical protein QFZ63_002958 [Streptomyces sp. B3I7]|uniref:hypothetical protein n=1 Tax=Streptomyces sp. B3I7 TaxID=3042269 RepID=UPI0027814D0C|nr:hypothetical protein [Streptomyces sp. B3I7]MDQ0811244.1 hypothetical protein [Streptomyces sp. B3I7]